MITLASASNSPAVAKSDEAARTILEALGVVSLHDFSEGTLIAPFSHLDMLSASNPSTGSRVLKLPDSTRRVFFHSLETPQHCEELLRSLLCDSKVRLVPIKSQPRSFAFSEDKDICGPLAGLTVQSQEEVACWGLVFESRPTAKLHTIISLGPAGVLLQIKEAPLEIFMLLASPLCHPGQRVEQNLDIRKCLLSLAAPVMVLKYLARDCGWRSGRNYANLIIDDPPLSLRYGHIDFRLVLEHATRRGTSITIAYIPFNHRRGNRESAHFFRAASDRISFCIHGCNHTKSEFGFGDAVRISSLTSLACDRMNSFSQRTGVSHSKIMVFPQGVFSSLALGVLKRHNFSAAVNTEAKDASGKIHLTIKDLLQPAITAYHSLPLFLRRKTSDDIGNFAFDMLLGKPCLIVAHHDDFVADNTPIWKLLDGLEKLPIPLEWVRLKDLVAGTGLTRTMPGNRIEARMFSRVCDLSTLANGGNADSLCVVKEESEPETIEAIFLGERRMEWDYSDGKIMFPLEDRSNRPVVTVVYRQHRFSELPQTRIADRARVWCRRRSSEFRDNYVWKYPSLNKVVQIAKRLF